VVAALLMSWAAACPVPTTWTETDPNRVALAALAHTVRALEIAFPRTVIASRLPVGESDPLREDLRYLRERNLTPRDLSLAAFDQASWQALLDRFMGWYGLPSQPVARPETPELVLRDLQRAVDRVVEAVRPVALLAFDPVDEDRLVFVGVLWNWSSYPRLIVQRPGEGWTMREGPRALAARLDPCGISVSDYIVAPAPVARDLFLANNSATMYLVGSEPETAGAWPYQVPPGEEVAVFDFGHPEVRHLDAFSAVFVGDALSFMTMLRHLPSVRTNLSPARLLHVLQTPPRGD
jgi:hypothetical protein